jgi:hypothetical protein
MIAVEVTRLFGAEVLFASCRSKKNVVDLVEAF